MAGIVRGDMFGGGRTDVLQHHAADVDDSVVDRLFGWLLLHGDYA